MDNHKQRAGEEFANQLRQGKFPSGSSDAAAGLQSFFRRFLGVRPCRMQKKCFARFAGPWQPCAAMKDAGADSSARLPNEASEVSGGVNFIEADLGGGALSQQARVNVTCENQQVTTQAGEWWWNSSARPMARRPAARQPDCQTASGQRTNDQRPAFRIQRPAASRQQPAASGQRRPVASGQRAQASGQRSAASGPAATGQQPAASSHSSSQRLQGERPDGKTARRPDLQRREG